MTVDVYFISSKNQIAYSFNEGFSSQYCFFFFFFITFLRLEINLLEWTTKNIEGVYQNTINNIFHNGNPE